MSDPASMIGEREIQATAAVLNRPVHVIIEGSQNVCKYNENARSTEGPVTVKFIPREDAGHYEGMVLISTSGSQLNPVGNTELCEGIAPRISSISPVPKLSGTKRKANASSKSQVLTSSPYKQNLEGKKKKNNKINNSIGKTKTRPKKNVGDCKPTTSRQGQRLSPKEKNVAQAKKMMMILFA